MSNERAEWFFYAVQRLVHAQDDYVKNRTTATEKELKESCKVVRDEVFRVEEIQKKEAQKILPNLDLDKLV